MIIIIIALILFLMLLIRGIYRDKINFFNIKLKIIEEKLNSTLIKRRELIKDAEVTIKEVVETKKEIFEGLSKLNNENINMMELDKKLLIHMNEFYLIKDKYQKLNKNENFQNIVFKLNETEDQLNAYKDYYNLYAEKYNKVIKSFPIIIITTIRRRKEKPFFDKKNINYNDFN